jgi:hypothetical protein
MRKLYLIPIIHMSADLGTLAPAMDKRGVVELGEDFWLRHKRTVTHFWDSIAEFLDSLEVEGFKIYQDGLIANGEMGMRIVEEGVKEGSKNYGIISGLLKRGASLVRTEDLSLVKKEYDSLSKVAQSKLPGGKIIASLRYKLIENRLLKERDKFIANRIDETLREGETGILFIGAYHDVIPKLPWEIEITEVKETEKVREYQRELLNWRRDKRRFEQLIKYLASLNQS